MSEPTVRLTPRERVIFQHLTSGLNVPEIAEKESCTMKTVHYHKDNVFKKLGVHTTIKAIIKLSRLGLIHVDWGTQ
jgi:DNA-binding NarL/FixJ family response regulator